MIDEMPPAMRDLLQAHHGAVLRELDEINRGIKEVGHRTLKLEMQVVVLTWAYGLAGVGALAIFAKQNWWTK